MPRHAIAYTSLVGNGGANIPAGTVYDSANGYNILVPRTAIPGAADAIDRIFLYCTNTDSGNTSHTVTIKGNAGSTPSLRGGTAGTDLAVTIDHVAGATIIGPLDTARFAQSDGSINVDSDVSLDSHGTISAYCWPDRW